MSNDGEVSFTVEYRAINDQIFQVLTKSAKGGEIELPVFEDVIYDKKEGIAKITINRPRAYTALTTKTLEELTLAFEDADRDPTVGVVVLTGAGDKAFCSGGDLKEAAQPGGYNEERKGSIADFYFVPETK